MPPNDAIPCVYIVRHGRTTLNAQNSFRGNVDPPLDSVGVEQAHKLASLFSNQDICAIFISDKQRARKTAEIIDSGRGIPIHESSNLNALNVGKFSGQKRSKENVQSLQQFLANPDAQIPGGESLNEFRARVDPCIHEAVRLFLKTGIPPMVVCHSSVVREVGHLVYGDHKKILVEPGGAIALYFRNGELGAEPIFRPMADSKKADTIS